MSPFPQGNAVLLLKQQWQDLHGTEHLDFGGTKRGSIPWQVKGEEESEEPGKASVRMWGRGCPACGRLPEHGSHALASEQLLMALSGWVPRTVVCRDLSLLPWGLEPQHQ